SVCDNGVTNGLTDSKCASATVNITVSLCPAPPVLPVTAPAGVCANSAGNQASVTPAGGATTYTSTLGNGTITAGQGTPTITFTSITDAPCASGNASNEIHVTTNASPVITQQPPASINIKVGDTATMSVTATGMGINYYWYEGTVGDTSNRVADGTATFTTPH